jgi:hypothetical protein
MEIITGVEVQHRNRPSGKRPLDSSLDESVVVSRKKVAKCVSSSLLTSEALSTHCFNAQSTAIIGTQAQLLLQTKEISKSPDDWIVNNDDLETIFMSENKGSNEFDAGVFEETPTVMGDAPYDDYSTPHHHAAIEVMELWDDESPIFGNALFV